MTGGTAGATFKPGDMLGIGGELFQVADLATFSGSPAVATVNTVNRVRSSTGINSGTAVLWDKPTANWRLASPVPQGYESVFALPLDFELIQTWAS